MVTVGGAGTGYRDVLYFRRHARLQHVAGAVDINVIVPLPVRGSLQNRSQMDDMGDPVFGQGQDQLWITDVQHFQRKLKAIPLVDVGAEDKVILGQPVAQLVADITGSACNKNAFFRIHDVVTFPVSLAGTGSRAQICERVRPDTRCQTPQKAVISIMPPASGKKVNRITSPRPEFWMPTSRVTARRSGTSSFIIRAMA